MPKIRVNSIYSVDMTEKEFIENYDVTKYERPSVTVDTLIFSVNEDMKLEILLKQRDDFPFKDKWCIPGGFVGINESLDEAANRVLKEKTGAEDLFLEQLYTFGAVDRDPRMRVITVTYTAMVPKAKVKLQAENASWFIIDDFDNCNYSTPYPHQQRHMNCRQNFFQRNKYIKSCI